MAIFGSKKKDVVLKNGASAQKESKANNASTIVTNGIRIEGNITGLDTITIDGIVVGNIVIKNSVIVSKNGRVIGNMQAPRIISSGVIEGNIRCDHLEVLRAATLKSAIKAQSVIVYGKIQGQIQSNNVDIEIDGFVTDKIQAKNVNMSGTFEGEIACDLLSTKDTAVIKGGIFVKNISNQGGKIEGSIGQYKEVIFEKKEKVAVNIEKKEEPKSTN